MSQEYDICIIGGGPAGYAATMRAMDFGVKVCLIEKSRLGGAGVWNGALASKTMWEVSHEVNLERQLSEKFERDYYVPSYKQIIKEVSHAEIERSDQMKYHIDCLIKAKGAGKLDYIKGSGKLISPFEVEVAHGDKKTIIKTKNIVLATGSRPRYLPNIPIDEDIIVTSDGIQSWKKFPKSMVVVGAGVIGCEYTTMFSNFGKTQVHLISKDDRILPHEDVDVSEIVENNFEKYGVHIHKNADLVEMKISKGKVKYQLCFHGDRCEWFEAERALVSVGRVPNVEDLGLEEIGVRFNKRGFIEDDDTQTSIPNIYAVGDLTADIALVNVGELEGRHAVERIMKKSVKPLRYDNISTIMFLNPEVAGVGLNESQCIAKGIDYKVVKVDYSTIARAIAMRKTKGFFKIIVTDDDTMKVLGMRAAGEHASSAIQAVALLIATDKGVDELAEMIHPHPSIIEGIQECLRVLLGKSIYKPSVFGKHMSAKSYKNGVYTNIVW